MVISPKKSMICTKCSGFTRYCHHLIWPSAVTQLSKCVTMLIVKHLHYKSSCADPEAELNLNIKHNFSYRNPLVCVFPDVKSRFHDLINIPFSAPYGIAIAELSRTMYTLYYSAQKVTSRSLSSESYETDYVDTYTYPQAIFVDEVQGWDKW